MNEYRVGTLRIRVRIAAGRAASITPRVEQFTRAVLERVADDGEARAPGRLVFMRRLPLRWRLGEQALEDPRAVDRCAADIARVLAAWHPSGPLGVIEDEIAVFEGEAQWRAAHLLARARHAEVAWCLRTINDEGAPVEHLCMRPGLALQALAALADAGALWEVLDDLDEQDLERLAWTFGGIGKIEPASKAPASIVDELAAFGRAASHDHGPRAVRIALQVEAYRRLGSATDARVIESAVVAGAALASRRIPDRPRPILVTPGTARDRDFDVEPSIGGTCAATRFGGLFYLLSLALELDLGEILWKTCLPEGEVLAAAAAALLGPEAVGDPAPALFGGVREIGASAVSAEQQEEVAVALTVALAAALPRRGLAALPEVIVSVASVSTARRFLIATAARSSFVIFAHPLVSLRDVSRAMRAFLNAWPRGGPSVRVTPSLAEANPAIRVALAPARPHPPFFPEAVSGDRAALMAQVVGTLCCLFAWRLGDDNAVTAEHLALRHLAVPARMSLVGGRLVVSLAYTSLLLRRAGLDRCPEWVPWLNKTVNFHFADAENF